MRMMMMKKKKEKIGPTTFSASAQYAKAIKSIVIQQWLLIHSKGMTNDDDHYTAQNRFS